MKRCYFHYYIVFTLGKFDDKTFWRFRQELLKKKKNVRIISKDNHNELESRYTLIIIDALFYLARG